MSERSDRLNELRKAKGLKPLKEAVDKAFPEVISQVVETKSPFEEAIETEKPKVRKPRKKTKKEEVVIETTESANTDVLFEKESDPVNKEEVKVEEPKEELLNE
jgi:hypothetical protein